MKILDTKQIYALQHATYDLFLCVSGYEKRSSNFARRQVLNAKAKTCLKFNTYTEEFARKENDKFFIENGFNVIEADGDSPFIIESILNELITNSSDSLEIKLIIDYSSMTRVWYAEIVRFFDQLELESKHKIQLYFVYSFSLYSSSPNSDTKNFHIGPIKGFNKLSVPDKPTALILGLGYEKDRAYGLTEYLDAETYVFCTDNSYQQEFAKNVVSSNRELLSNIDENRIYQYPVRDLEYTEYLLYNLCKDLSENFRIIIAPCGPKPFTLISLVVASKLSGIDVWRISAGKNAHPFDSLPNGDTIIYRIIYEN